MHKCRSSGPDKLNLWPFYHLTFKCDLDLQPIQTFQMALLLLKENNCAKLFWNPCINVGVMMAWTSSMWPSSVTEPSTYLKIVSNGTFPPQGQQLCQIISKSMHKRSSWHRQIWTHAYMQAHTPYKTCNSYVLLYCKGAWQKWSL